MIAQLAKNPPALLETLVQFLSREDLLEKGEATHSCILGFPCGSAGKESACSPGNRGLIPGLGRSPGEGKGYPLQYSGLENSTDCIVHGVAKSWIQLSIFHFHFFMYICIYLASVESACSAGDVGLIPGLGISPGEGNGNPLQYSCLG